MTSSSAVRFTSGGIDVSSIVSGLMQVERQPVDRLISRQTEVKAKRDAIGRITSQLETLRTAARDVVIRGVTKVATSVSDTTAVAATAGATATPGSTTFTVGQLATTHSLRTGSPVTGTSATVVDGARLAISASSSRLGFRAHSASDGVAAGTYSLEVTQSSSAAVKTGSALGATTVITASNNVLDLTASGVASSVTLDSGTYTTEQLAAHLQTKLGGSVAASATESGQLRLATVSEGSAATLRVTGGSALTTLGLSVDAADLTGGDARVRVDGGAVVTVTATGNGSSVALTVGGGTLTATDLGPLRVGSSTVTVVDTGDRSLAGVVAAVNGANVGVGAAAIRQQDANWYLQLTSASSGSAGRVVVGATGWTTLAEARDASLVVGSGPGALTVTSSSNTFTDVMPGVTITAKAVTTSPITVSVSRDEAATADAVQALLTTANTLLADIKSQTRYDAVNRRGGPLTGDATVRSLAVQIRAAVTETVAGLTSGVSSVGITTQRDGTFALDRAAFTAALRADPAVVDRLFRRSGSSAGTNTTFVGADDSTAAGTYAVAVTTAATRATSAVVEAIPGRTLGVRIGSTSASVPVAAGASPAEIVAALNSAVSSAGLGVVASVSGNGLVVTSATYGAAGGFELNTNMAGGGSWTTHTGVDVVGTVDNVAAIGVGRRLSVPADSSSSAKGLQIEVAPNVTGSLASVTYSPGAAARLTRLLAQLTGSGGPVTTASAGYDTRVGEFARQISRFEEKLQAREEQLRAQWSKVQTTLSGLETQQNWLTNQIKGLNGGDR